MASLRPVRRGFGPKRAHVHDHTVFTMLQGHHSPPGGTLFGAFLSRIKPKCGLKRDLGTRREKGAKKYAKGRPKGTQNETQNRQNFVQNRTGWPQGGAGGRQRGPEGQKCTSGVSSVSKFLKNYLKSDQRRRKKGRRKGVHRRSGKKGAAVTPLPRRGKKLFTNPMLCYVLFNFTVFSQWK